MVWLLNYLKHRRLEPPFGWIYQGCRQQVKEKYDIDLLLNCDVEQ
jgi:hypothetical protein